MTVPTPGRGRHPAAADADAGARLCPLRRLAALPGWSRFAALALVAAAGALERRPPAGRRSRRQIE
jgi:hypothetical protein